MQLKRLWQDVLKTKVTSGIPEEKGSSAIVICFKHHGLLLYVFHVVQEPTVEHRLVLNSQQSSCLSLPRTWVSGLSYHACLNEFGLHVDMYVCELQRGNSNCLFAAWDNIYLHTLDTFLLVPLKIYIFSKPGMIAHTCDPSIQEAEASLGYRDFVSKNETRQEILDFFFFFRCLFVVFMVWW